MKKFIVTFFVFLGVIFFIIILSLGYIYMTNMYGVRALFSKGGDVVTKDGASSTENKNPLLNSSQERALEKIGVNPSALPSKITPEMSACFDSILGKARTLEIKNGSSPTASEFISVRSCL